MPASKKKAVGSPARVSARRTNGTPSTANLDHRSNNESSRPIDSGSLQPPASSRTTSRISALGNTGRPSSSVPVQPRGGKTTITANKVTVPSQPGQQSHEMGTQRRIEDMPLQVQEGSVGSRSEVSVVWVCVMLGAVG